LTPKIIAIYGSPRRDGNASTLLKNAVAGVKSAQGEVEEIVLRDLKMSPCLEIYGCKETGRCVIQDDFQRVYDQLVGCDGLIIASPIFFYTVSSHTKILIDRCQSFWVKKHWIQGHTTSDPRVKRRKGLFISVGATKGKRLFDGALLSMKYFLDAVDAELWRSLLYRGLDFMDDIQQHPDYVDEAFKAGSDLCEALRAGD
jgi:multimeric flavodoxin WrbA